MTTPRIALIHAVTVSMEPVSNAFAQFWPEARLLNLLEDALAVDRQLQEDLSENLFQRIGGLADYAVSAGVDGVLFTCSAFGPAIEAAAARLDVPVYKPNQAMFDEALSTGARIGMIATFMPSIATMEAEFYAAAEAKGLKAQLDTIFVPDALDALKGGDTETHNRLIGEQAAALSHCDAIMLAHFSTSQAMQTVKQVLAQPVLSSPVAAVKALRRDIDAKAPPA